VDDDIHVADQVASDGGGQGGADGDGTVVVLVLALVAADQQVAVESVEAPDDATHLCAQDAVVVLVDVVLGLDQPLVLAGLLGLALFLACALDTDGVEERSGGLAGRVPGDGEDVLAIGQALDHLLVEGDHVLVGGDPPGFDVAGGDAVSGERSGLQAVLAVDVDDLAVPGGFGDAGGLAAAGVAVVQEPQVFLELVE
jgi:hypothetical protein